MTVLATPPHPLRPVAFASAGVSVQERPDGTILVEPDRPLGPFPVSMCERLEHWATVSPDRIFMAERDAVGGWRGLTYGEALESARRIGAGLVARGLSAERPLVILSGNDIDHALLALGAMHVGIPYCPVSPAYALVSSDHAKLRWIFELLTPGLVFVADGRSFAAALDAVWPAHAETVVARHAPAGRRISSVADLLGTAPSPEAEGARAAVTGDTIVKFLLTSGSTGLPKAVINTQRMLCANQVMLRETLAFLRDGPTLLDWLPWNHTFGGNHNVGIVLYNGGTLHLDTGKPTPDGIGHTVANLRDVRPTVYFNVPKGYEALVPYLREDRSLRESFFSNLQAMFFSGAGMAPHVWSALDDLAVDVVGARIPILTGLGATETAPFALCCSPENTGSGRVGVPVPGNALKLVPAEGKLEARVKGPNVTPGYWRQPDLTAKAFDEEGYYSFGDALAFVDRDDIAQGFRFDGRIAEDFKLATGTWVSVGPLRAKVVAACAPLVRDVVLAGLNRDEVTGIVVLDTDAAARFAGIPVDAQPGEIARHPAVVGAIRLAMTRLADQPGGSSTRVVRAVILDAPLDIDAGEVTDKGSINQRAVLAHRSGLVERLYADPIAEPVLVFTGIQP